jgi:Fe-S oxidoreductase
MRPACVVPSCAGFCQPCRSVCTTLKTQDATNEVGQFEANRSEGRTWRSRERGVEELPAINERRWRISLSSCCSIHHCMQTTMVYIGPTLQAAVPTRQVHAVRRPFSSACYSMIQRFLQEVHKRTEHAELLSHTIRWRYLVGKWPSDRDTVKYKIMV